ncbi:hypothetical protein EDB84DRAFT_250946 [Lactarius hengduanensis]|nr:hypothetical protein EDB84DRAFT_250946 [Lactarius hengduanensis]
MPARWSNCHRWGKSGLPLCPSLCYLAFDVFLLPKALSRLATRSRGHYELEEIRLNLKRKEELEVASVLIRFHTLTGINFIFYFGTTFFTNASIHNPFLVSIATSTVSVGMALPGIWGVKRFACCSLARLA